MSSTIRPTESPIEAAAQSSVESSVSSHVPPAASRVAASPASQIAAISAEIPLEIHGSRKSHTDGHPIEPFQEETVSVIVFPNGGIVRLAADVSKGQMVAVTNLNTQRGMLCRVANVRTYPNLKHYVEVEFAQSAPGFWGVKFPNQVTSMEKPGVADPREAWPKEKPSAVEPREVSSAAKPVVSKHHNVSPAAKPDVQELRELSPIAESAAPKHPEAQQELTPQIVSSSAPHFAPPPAPPPSKLEVIANHAIADEPNLVHVSADEDPVSSEIDVSSKPRELKAEDFWGASFPAEMMDAVAPSGPQGGSQVAPIPLSSKPSSPSLPLPDAHIEHPAHAEPIDLAIDNDETWSELLSQIPTRPEKPAPARAPEIPEEDFHLESVAPAAHAPVAEFSVTPTTAAKRQVAETLSSQSASPQLVSPEQAAVSAVPPENFNPASPAALKELERLALGHLDTNPIQRQQEPPVAPRPPKGAGRTRDSKRSSPARVSPARARSDLVSTDLADLQQPYQHQPASSAAALHSFTSASGGGAKESVQPAAAPGTEKLTFGNFLKDPEPRTSAQRVFSEHSDVMSASILAAAPPLHATQTRSSSNFFLLVAAAVIFCAAGGLIFIHSMSNASSKPAVVGKPWAEQTPAPPGNLRPNAQAYELPDSSSATSLPDSSDLHSAAPEAGLEVDLNTAVTPPSKNGAGASPRQSGRTSIPALNLSAPTSDTDNNGPSNISVVPPPVVSGSSATPTSAESLSTYAANPNANIPRPAAPNPAAADPVAANPPAVNAPAAKTPAAISAGGLVTQPRLIWSSSPVYPTLAKQANIQGDVKIEITINELGHVTKTKALSGPTLLQQPAINAVRDWKYTPSTLNGKPVPVQLIVTVQFRR